MINVPFPHREAERFFYHTGRVCLDFISNTVSERDQPLYLFDRSLSGTDLPDEV